MLVQPTGKWINSIAVPNCGIIRKPFNSEVVNIPNDVGTWLIEAGFAVGIEEPLAQAEVIRERSLPETPAEPVKPKKSPKLFVNPEES